jgi:hypothetical protein
VRYNGVSDGTRAAINTRLLTPFSPHHHGTSSHRCHEMILLSPNIRNEFFNRIPRKQPSKIEGAGERPAVAGVLDQAVGELDHITPERHPGRAEYGRIRKPEAAGALLVEAVSVFR